MLTNHRQTRNSLPAVLTHLARKEAKRQGMDQVEDVLEKTAYCSALVHYEVWSGYPGKTARALLSGAVRAAKEDLRMVSALIKEGTR